MNLKKPSKYIISGSKYFLDKNTDKLLKDYEDVDVTTFFGDEFNKEDFFTFISSPSLFYDSKVSIVRNSEKIKDINELINKAFQSIDSSIIFLFNEYDSKKIKLIDNAKKEIEIILEKKVTKYNVVKEIQKMFSDKGFRIKNITAEDIYEMCLQNIMLVSNELEKIQIYYHGKDKLIDDKEILEIISFTKNETIFKFIDSFFDRNKQITLYSLDNIIAAGESPEMLFFMLSKRAQHILYYKISPSLVKAHPYTLSKIEKSASIWSNKEIYMLINEISEIDFKMKTSNLNIINSLNSLISFL